MNLLKLVINNTYIILLLFLCSCEKIFDICVDENNGPGAIVLTFDDRYIDDWYAADSIFSFYNWRATFCVTDYGKVSEEEKQKLLELQSNGHEIAHHGYKHFNATEYLSNHTMEEYIQNEISPSLDLMTNDGLNINSFV